MAEREGGCYRNERQRERQAEKHRETHRDGDGKLYYRFFAVAVPPCIRVCSLLSQLEHRLPRV